MTLTYTGLRHVLELARVNDPELYRQLDRASDTALAPYIAFHPDAAAEIATLPEAQHALCVAFAGEIVGDRSIPASALFTPRGTAMTNVCYALGNGGRALRDVEGIRKVITAVTMQNGIAQGYTKQQPRSGQVALPCDYSQLAGRTDVGLLRTDFDCDASPQLAGIIDAICSAARFQVDDVLLRFRVDV